MPALSVPMTAATVTYYRNAFFAKINGTGKWTIKHLDACPKLATMIMVSPYAFHVPQAAQSVITQKLASSAIKDTSSTIKMFARKTVHPGLTLMSCHLFASCVLTIV